MGGGGVNLIVNIFFGAEIYSSGVQIFSGEVEKFLRGLRNFQRGLRNIWGVVEKFPWGGGVERFSGRRRAEKLLWGGG